MINTGFACSLFQFLLYYWVLQGHSLEGCGLENHRSFRSSVLHEYYLCYHSKWCSRQSELEKQALQVEKKKMHQRKPGFRETVKKTENWSEELDSADFMAALQAAAALPQPIFHPTSLGRVKI